MPRLIYTKEHIDFVREIAPGRYIDEITKLFNDKFGTNLTENKMKSFKGNHKINSGVVKKRVSQDGRLFTKEQEDFIKDNVKGRLNQELADLLNETFGLSITAKQMNSWKKNHGQISGLNTRFKKGQAPANKGTKGVYNVGGNKTSFKKGQKSHNYKPVGTERVDRDGYVLLKVSDKGEWHERWRLKHLVVWEEANGSLPEGHCLLFLDGNKQNVELDNLKLITRSQLARLNQRHLLTNDPELNKTAIVVADIIGTMGKRRKELKRKRGAVK